MTFLGRGRVIPEVGGGHFMFEAGYLALFVGDVKGKPLYSSSLTASSSTSRRKSSSNKSHLS